MSTTTLPRPAPGPTTIRPAFRALLDDAHDAWTALAALSADHVEHPAALARWTASCLAVVTAVSTRAEANALEGLDGRSADDWIRYLLALGLDG